MPCSIGFVEASSQKCKQNNVRIAPYIIMSEDGGCTNELHSLEVDSIECNTAWVDLGGGGGFSGLQPPQMA